MLSTNSFPEVRGHRIYDPISSVLLTRDLKGLCFYDVCQPQTHQQLVENSAEE